MKHRVPLVPAALLAMLVLLPAGTGAANPSYDPGASASRWVVTDLGNLGMANVTVSDINDRGQIVGEGATRDGLGRGFIWQDGSMTALGQGQFAAAHQINECGQIMGWSSIGWNSSVAFAEEHAVLWKNKRMIDLHGGTHIWASAINDRGQIVGERNSNAFMWQAGMFQTLWPDGGALAVNNRGEVVGASATHTVFGTDEAMLWQSGKVTDLGPVRQRTSTTAAKSSGSIGSRGGQTPKPRTPSLRLAQWEQSRPPFGHERRTRRTRGQRSRSGDGLAPGWGSGPRVPLGRRIDDRSGHTRR